MLWGRQGLVGGAYKDQGVYTQEGDLEAIPEAPEWLLAYMKDSFRGKQKLTRAKRPALWNALHRRALLDR